MVFEVKPLKQEKITEKENIIQFRHIKGVNTLQILNCIDTGKKIQNIQRNM